MRRLCDPKLFTGTAATGHLPTTVDLEGGVGVSDRSVSRLFCCAVLTPDSRFAISMKGVTGSS